jgi:hypothetical protein
MPVTLMVMDLLISVNITFVLLCMKTLGELITVQKDTQKSGVIVHSKNIKLQNPAQVNGLVMISLGLPNVIWDIMTKTVMVKSMSMITSEISLHYMLPVILMVINPLLSVNITSVLSTTKMNGDYLLAQKDIHLSGVTVHSQNTKLQNPAQVNGLVTILNGLPPPISNG